MFEEFGWVLPRLERLAEDEILSSVIQSGRKFRPVSLLRADVQNYKKQADIVQINSNRAIEEEYNKVSSKQPEKQRGKAMKSTNKSVNRNSHSELELKIHDD
jgi:hypothetical protein